MQTLCLLSFYGITEHHTHSIMSSIVFQAVIMELKGLFKNIRGIMYVVLYHFRILFGIYCINIMRQNM